MFMNYEEPVFLYSRSITAVSLKAKTFHRLTNESYCQFTNEEYGQSRKSIWNYLIYALKKSR